MEQLRLFKEEQEKICAFTGHRLLEEDFSSEKLLSYIEQTVDEGYFTFLNGMAMGFDLLAAEFVLTLKVENPRIRLIACVPCEEQDKYYTQEDKTRYRTVLDCADETLLFSKHYRKGCMLERDRYMAEQAERLITYCKKQKGGTAYTVRHFQKTNPNGLILYV